jgi:hypothetical protein
MSEIGVLGKLWDGEKLFELAQAAPNFGRYMN